MYIYKIIPLYPRLKNAESISYYQQKTEKEFVYNSSPLIQTLFLQCLWINKFLYYPLKVQTDIILFFY